MKNITVTGMRPRGVKAEKRTKQKRKEEEEVYDMLREIRAELSENTDVKKMLQRGRRTAVHMRRTLCYYKCYHPTLLSKCMCSRR